MLDEIDRLTFGYLTSVERAKEAREMEGVTAREREMFKTMQRKAVA